MSTNSPDSGPPRARGWLARLTGMIQTSKPSEEESNPDDLMPNWDTEAPQATPAAPPAPAAAPAGGAAAVPTAAPAPPGTTPVAVALPVAAEPVPAEAAPVAEPLEEAPPAPKAEAAPEVLCPVCGFPHQGRHPYCSDCGYHFAPADLVPRAAGAAPAAAGTPGQPGRRLQDRFEVRERISERDGVRRYRGLDHGDGSGPPVPVIIVEQDLPEMATPLEEATPVAENDSDEVLPSFDFPTAPSAPSTEILPAGRPPWPSIGWERGLLRTIEQPALPAIVANFNDDQHEYLVEEVPAGQPLWDAWDDPASTADKRFGWLQQIAETLHSLHHCNAILEALRPDIIVVAPDGHARLTDVSDLLPLPVPADAPVRGSLYTAPELMSGRGQADARADLYSFGALLYALHVGRELAETDFDKPGHGNPKPFIPRFPDIHPAFGRLMTKTFRREVEARFPTDEAGKEDATGFLELIRTLGVLRRTLDNVRMEIASWTTTGIVRTGNEDAFALIHACESRQDDLGESALVLLCDGMGGYEAGEVAAALAIQVLRHNLVHQKPFGPLAGGSLFPTDVLSHAARPEGHAGPALDVEAAKQLIKAALKEANKQVFQASRAPGAKRRGMGCTAEVVYLDGRNVVVGHVGDSRTYHLHEGRLIQLTRDQTLVNRLVELGTLTPEEAETHPRRNELQQAVGGQPDVEPGLYHGVLKPGDWVVVCSDGVTNHVGPNDLKQMLQSEAASAEMAARRLVNLTNIEGATDNATVVVIRAT